MRKEIKKDGNSHKIRITKEEMKLYKLKEGQVIELNMEEIK